MTTHTPTPKSRRGRYARQHTVTLYWSIYVIAALVLAAILLASCAEIGSVADEEPTETSAPEPVEPVAETEPPEPAPEPEPEPEPASEPEPEFTVSQEQAIGAASDYLSFTAFSRTGLIEQLVYEGFSEEDAIFAVDYLDVDWKEQAAQSARDYLEFTNFSRSGLIEQLKYEGFTDEEATYGVDQTGL